MMSDNLEADQGNNNQIMPKWSKSNFIFHHELQVSKNRNEFGGIGGIIIIHVTNRRKAGAM